MKTLITQATNALWIALMVCSSQAVATDLRDTAVQYKVEALDALGATRITSAVAVQVAPEGLLLTTASPFTQARVANRIKILTTSGEDASRYIRSLELLFVDMSADIAVLRMQSEHGSGVGGAKLSQRPVQIEPGVSYRTVRFEKTENGVIRPQVVDLMLVAPNRFNSSDGATLSVGSPVIGADGALIGLINILEPNGAVGIKPVSVESLPPSVATAVTGSPSANGPSEATKTKESFQFSELQNTHVGGVTLREYTKSFHAPVGRKIVDVNFSIASANHVRNMPSAQIASDGKTATVRYSIESGPFWDRWRGWLHGDVHLTLVPDR